MRFTDRLAATVLALLIGIDQLAQTVLVAPFAVAALANPPEPDATISGVLGRAVAIERTWAILPAALVDALFLVLTLGRERNHCARTAAHEFSAFARRVARSTGETK